MQIIDVSNPTAIVALDAETDDNNDFNIMKDPFDVDVFTLGTSTYAIITSTGDNGVTIIDISDPTDISVVDSLVDSGSLKLASADGVDVFTIHGNTYAIVTTGENEGSIQIIELSTETAFTVSKTTSVQLTETMSFIDTFTAKYGTARISESISFSDSVQIERSPFTPNLYALPAENKVTLAWTKQNDSTVAQITDYIIEHSNDNGSTWMPINEPTSKTRAYTVEPGKHSADIQNGQNTLFRVAAVNSVGTGPFSSVQAAPPESDNNLIVRDVSVTQGPEKIEIMWNPHPSYVADITDYLVYHSTSPSGPWTL